VAEHGDAAESFGHPVGHRSAAPVLAADRSLSIVCVGGGAFSSDEVALIERAGLAGQVSQHSVAEDQLAACYANAAAFVFPSRYEGFGIPILEAFGCGCPALVADASCFPEIAGDAALYFHPDDRDSLRGALEKVLGDPALAASLRAKGRARAAQFTWKSTADQTYAAYRDVCAATSRSAVA